MAVNYVSLALQPGIYRNGTEYQAKTRYYDCNLIRFDHGAIRPRGGWIAFSTSAVAGKPRAMLAWKDNHNISRAGIGTHTGLYTLSRSGELADITPADLPSGRPIAVQGGGYGTGPYGRGPYGVGRVSSSSSIVDATMWTLDTWGEDLIGCNKNIYQWEPGDPVATIVANAPTENRAVVVTGERIMMALGADGNPRDIKWSDQEDNTEWTPLATNQAGEFPLQTAGRIMLGKAARDYTLILTDIDAWVANYLGAPLVYGFTKAGVGGAISQGCAAVLDSDAVWMSQTGFYRMNGGFSEELPCDVKDYVFSDINRMQLSLVTCSVNADFGEVEWRYPSAASNEVDRYVVWNYHENHWAIGQLDRLSAVDRGVFRYPLMAGSDGYIYQHEYLWNYDAAVPFLRSGPFEIGTGSNVATAREIVPDQLTTGSVRVSFKTRYLPNGPETAIAAVSATARNDLRFTCRQMEILYEGTGGDFRVGDVRIDFAMGGNR